MVESDDEDMPEAAGAASSAEAPAAAAAGAEVPAEGAEGAEGARARRPRGPSTADAGGERKKKKQKAAGTGRGRGGRRNGAENGEGNGWGDIELGNLPSDIKDLFRLIIKMILANTQQSRDLASAILETYFVKDDLRCAVLTKKAMQKYQEEKGGSQMGPPHVMAFLAFIKGMKTDTNGTMPAKKKELEELESKMLSLNETEVDKRVPYFRLKVLKKKSTCLVQYHIRDLEIRATVESVLEGIGGDRRPGRQPTTAMERAIAERLQSLD